ncbi:MAG TPA: 2-oxo acid dehydrogenase subunit E2 [Aggregatilineales bacterium]|nr:2-oxo acid dehydrogenase subunit E2 [Aggregatilineales bacterium]
MAVDIVMPNLGFDSQEAHIVEWLKKPGDPVRKGEIIAVVESDKASVELESIESGTLLEVFYPNDSDVIVGSVIARIGHAEEASVPLNVRETPSRPQTMPAENQRPPTPVYTPPLSPVDTGMVEVSPVARRMASDHGLDLSKVQGSGPRGRITREDVEAILPVSGGNGNRTAQPVSDGLLALPKIRKMARDAGIDLEVVPATGKAGQITLADLRAYQHRLAAGAGALVQTRPGTLPPPVQLPERSQEIQLSRLQKVGGQRLSQSKQAAPHFYVTGEFDMEAALEKLEDLAAPPRINDLLQFLVVQTLLRVPELNATFVDSHLYRHESINLAIAVARSDGLITPVIQGADRFSLTGLAKESRALIQRTRDNHLQPSDLQNATFTISNLGMVQQVDHFTAVINPPQVAILAIGTLKPRPVVINGGLHIRNTVHLTLSGDHRVVDGMILARFMEVFQSELDTFSR